MGLTTALNTASAGLTAHGPPHLGRAGWPGIGGGASPAGAILGTAIDCFRTESSDFPDPSFTCAETV